ncbi:MAG TPA: NUDIX domain-containing protein [Allosphingosinicella sp.]|nr:NUDIX domain-containing protein [Allosphingosinicella sp.]
MTEGLSRKPLRWATGSFQKLRRAFWYFTRPETLGAHAVPLTRRGTIVLVKLRYAPGWRVPGGGRKASEDPREAVLRELREEIGMTAHGAVELVSELHEKPDFKRDTASLFIVRDVEYRPRWSIEVEAVKEVPADRLPDDLAGPTRRWLALVRPML